MKLFKTKTLFQRKQALANESGSRYYGDGGTIHQTNEVNIELDNAGNVVSVWFRCQMLPFTQRVVEDHRAEEMRRAYAYHNPPGISGIEVVDTRQQTSGRQGPTIIER